MRTRATTKPGTNDSTTNEGRAAHEQTSGDFAERLVGLRTNAHRELVRLALATGRCVPSRVLVKYPALLFECMKARAGYQM